MLDVGRGNWRTVVLEAGYHDQPHFVRDCQLFLDMPLSTFVAMPKPLFQASLRLRAVVIGAPAQALHPLAEEAVKPSIGRGAARR